MMTGNPIRVFVVDDHDLVIEGLSQILSRERDIVVVGSARSSVGLVENLLACRPHVVLLDAKMRERDFDPLSLARTLVSIRKSE
jgi:DNA-binding NarL/FixJ family response regulator